MCVFLFGYTYLLSFDSTSNCHTLIKVHFLSKKVDFEKSTLNYVLTQWNFEVAENYFLFSRGYIEWREAAKKTWMKRRKKDGYRMIRHLCASTFFLSHISKILSETCQHCHTNFASSTTTKWKRKAETHFSFPRQVKAKKKQTVVVLVTIYQPKLGSKDKASSNKWFVAPWKAASTHHTMAALVDFNCLFSPPSF